MLKKYEKRTFALIVVMVMFLQIMQIQTILTVNAAEGGPVSVGYLVDEDFSFLPSSNIPSGWDVDNPGGKITYDYCNMFKITDGSASAGATLKKSFVTQTAGKVTLEFCFNMPSKMDGCSWQLLASDSTTAVKILTSGGNLCYENSNGTAVTLQSYNANVSYGVKVVSDIDADTADIYVNGLLRATGVGFRNAVANINTIMIKTGDTPTGVMYIAPVKIYKGYIVNEKLLTTPVGSVPSDWTANTAGGTADVQTMNSSTKPDINSFKLNDISTTQNVSLSKSFDAQTGTVVWEYKFLIPTAADNMTWELCSGTAAAVKLITSGGNLCYVNSGGTNTVLQAYVANIWYTVKVVANISTSSADIYINGRQVAGSTTFANTVANVVYLNASTPVSTTGTMWLDDIAVYQFQSDPADYVPAPATVTNPSTIVGIQNCSLWREGHHMGWDVLSTNRERMPYLGRYDEGSREVADWEIKWMVEHGIDYQLYCWFRPKYGDGNPVKDPYMGQALHDGFFNAKYSNRMNYAIMWENGASSASGSTDFRNNLVPFWIEYYFKDPRYLKINNMPVMSIYSLSGLTRDFGSIAGAKAETDYLRQACINAGFSGIILLTSYSGTDSTELSNRAAAGFDNIYSYSWGYDCNNIDNQKNKMTTQRDAAKINVIPTLSMGRDDTPWNRTSGGFTKPSEYQALSTWARDTFMPSLPTGSLGQTMVMLDNWNEYGEGHFIMPAEMEGFGYLDAIRNVFGDGQTHTDTMPTLTQKNRVNSLYLPDRYLEVPYKNMVISPGFETTKINCTSWSAPLQVDTTEYRSGTQSLKVTKTNNYGSVKFNLPLKNQRTYYFSAWAKLPTGATSGQVLRLCVQYDLDGTTYQKIILTSPTLSTSQWLQVSGNYTLSLPGTVTNTSMYMYTDNPAVQEAFYLDDVEVYSIDNMVTDPGFESAAINCANWSAPTTLITTEHHSGYQALSAAKSNAYGSVRYSVPLEKGKPYNISFWAKLPTGATAGQVLRVCISYKLDGVSKSFIAFTSPVLSTTAWTRASSEYTINETGVVTEPSVYVFTDVPAVAETFYLDDVEICPVINKVNNPGFESGVGQFTGSDATLTSDTTQMHAGAKSLKVTKTGVNGAAYVDVPLIKQKTYDISAWVKLPTGGTAGQVAKLCVEYYIGTTKYQQVVATSAALSSTAWTSVSGNYTIDTSSDITNTKFYITTDTPAVAESFYVDDVIVK